MHPMLLDPAFAHLPYVVDAEPDPTLVSLADTSEFGAFVTYLDLRRA